MSKLRAKRPASNSPDSGHSSDRSIPLLTTEDGQRRIKAEIARLEKFVDEENSRRQQDGAAEGQPGESAGSKPGSPLVRKGSARGTI